MSSILGRNVYRVSGHHRIYPSQYILLHGLPAARKSSAISIGNNLLKEAGYLRFAPNRMSRQAFAMEMYAMNQPDRLGLDIGEILESTTEYPYEMTVHAGEFLDFIGQHDSDYLSLLTTLWDNPDIYDNPKMNGKPVRLVKPTVNLLGASTPKNMSLAFPASAMDTGNLSRMIFVYADPVPKSGRILNPEVPSEEATRTVLKRLEDMAKLKGPMDITVEANDVMEHIYKTADDHPDPRLQYYSGRRGTHLWKLAMVCAAMRNSMLIEDWDVLQANTLLAVAEHTMSRALGNFGRSKQSAVTHDVVEWVRNQGVVTIPDIYRQFNRDFTSESEFHSVITDLQAARRLINVEVNGEYLGLATKDIPFPAWQQKIMLTQALTDSELDIIGLTR